LRTPFYFGAHSGSENSSSIASGRRWRAFGRVDKETQQTAFLARFVTGTTRRRKNGGSTLFVDLKYWQGADGGMAFPRSPFVKAKEV